jgi:hypothetical protein
MRKLLCLFCFLFPLGAGCALSDLREDAVASRHITAWEPARGRALLDALASRHGGLDRWRAARDARVIYQDTWPSAVVAAAASPWPSPRQTIRQTLLLGQDISVVECLDGPEAGLTWGIQHWHTWEQAPGGALVWTDNEGVRFWLPTLQYFLEAPFRLGEADVVAWLGEAEAQGRRYELVFLSWGDAAPQEETDQYIAWIDRETGLLSYLEYTVRDMAGPLRAMIAYEGYRRADGFLVATTLRVVDAPGGETTLHRMDIEGMDFGVGAPASFLEPAPSRRRPKRLR